MAIIIYKCVSIQVLTNQIYTEMPVNQTVTNSTFEHQKLLEKISYFVAYTAACFLILVLVLWMFLLRSYIGENKRKMRVMRREATVLYHRIKSAQCDIIKLRLMIVVLLFELLTLISAMISLVGKQISIEYFLHERYGSLCLPLSISIEYNLLYAATVIHIITLCLICSLATLVLYINSTFSPGPGSGNTRVIKLMFGFLSLQVVLLLPIDLYFNTSYIAAYGYVVFNTVYYVMFIRGCLKLNRLLRWRRQDASFNPVKLSSAKRNALRVEGRYKCMVCIMFAFYSIFILAMNADLLIRDGILLPISIQCYDSLVKEVYWMIFSEKEPTELVSIILDVFRVLRLVAGISWSVFSLIAYTSVLIGICAAKLRKPKYTRFHVQYGSSLGRPLLTLKGMK